MASKKPKPDGMFPANFWDRPLPQKLGDPNPYALLLAVGFALSTWETAEEWLSFLCILLSKCTDETSSTAMRQVYGSIESSAGRRTALTKLHEVHFYPNQDKPEIRIPFNQLMEGFSSASRLRDDIAHGTVTRIDIVASSHGPQKYGCFLCPSSYNTGRNHPFINWESDDEDVFKIMRGKYRYTANDVASITKKFEFLKEKIIQHVHGIRESNNLRKIIMESQISKASSSGE